MVSVFHVVLAVSDDIKKIDWKSYEKFLKTNFTRDLCCKADTVMVHITWQTKTWLENELVR